MGEQVLMRLASVTNRTLLDEIAVFMNGGNKKIYSIQDHFGCDKRITRR